ncbi:MFS general substrate transporter [Leucosporidium creatinivorum]|uniref:MFS general substrate transporter n=1 Tax=Leucosporidium creatinivorum TaxID=106004 RepID=A0A1Y2FYV2_9BASI|nr:MFS general substrate transporter [Leucosporidium creatinivorum]
MAAPPINSTTPSYDESLEEKGVSAASSSELALRPTWYRSVFLQITIVGAGAFLSPGLWNGLSALGAGGAQEPWLVNAANSIVFGLMVVTCLFASTIVNRIGYRWSLVLGTAGYAPYAAGLYTNKLYGTTGLILGGSVLCGLSAGLFWGVEGAIVLGYPQPEKRGRMLAYWLGWRNAGGLLAGAINLGLNANTSTAGSVGASTYLVFIALQAVAPFIVFFLSEPSSVIRPDGKRPQMENHQGTVAEMREMWTIVKRKEVLFLVPISLYAQWSASYIGTFLSLYFSVRSRALASFLVPITSLIANFILGTYLDNTSIRKHIRCRSSYIACMTGLGGCWIWFTILQVRYISNPPKGLDWAQGHSFSLPFAAYIIVYTFYYLLQNELYYVISQLARHPHELVRLSSFLRGLESAGSACAFGVSSRKTLSKLVPLSLNFALWGISTVTAWFTVRQLGVNIDHTFASDESDEAKKQVEQQ